MAPKIPNKKDIIEGVIVMPRLQSDLRKDHMSDSNDDFGPWGCIVLCILACICLFICAGGVGFSVEFFRYLIR